MVALKYNEDKEKYYDRLLELCLIRTPENFHKSIREVFREAKAYKEIREVTLKEIQRLQQNRKQSEEQKGCKKQKKIVKSN